MEGRVPSPALNAIRRLCAANPGAYRITLRTPERQWSLETRSPADDIVAMAGEALNQVEARIEIDRGEGFYTLSPYARLAPPAPADAIEVQGPGDPSGLPVRLMVYDDATRSYVLDTAQFDPAYRLDASALPLDHLLRTRFYRWSAEGREWKPVGFSRRLTGSGKLGSPEIRAEHREQARVLAQRLEQLLPVAEGDTALIEFFDHVDFLADVPADAPQAERLETLAALAAGTSLLSLRARLIRYRPHDSKEPGPLLDLADVKPAFTAMVRYLKGEVKQEREARGLLTLSTRDDGDALASIVSGYLFKFLPEGIGVAPQDWWLGPIDGLIKEWDALSDGSVLVGELLNYVWLYALLQREAKAREQTFASFFDRNHLLDCIPAVLQQMEAMPAKRRGFHSTRMFLAKLASLEDRDRAAALFAEALAEDSLMKAAATFDGGADTYFSTAHLKAAESTIRARFDALAGELDIRGAPPAGKSEPVFLFSTDPRFLAIYLPGWLAQAEYCKARNLDFHFIVIGEPEAVARALENAERLRVALADLRGIDRATYADNVSYSTWRVPGWCPEPITFYACARYLALGALTARFGRDILVQDMDFTMVEDPQLFLSHFPKPGFGIQGSSGLYGIDAWRRFMGGTFFAPDADAARACLWSLESYLVEGLSRRRSWYLDQNALSYFFEQASDSGHELWSLKLPRPTQQPRVNQLFEAVQP